MLKQAAAIDWNDKDKKITPTCLHFINSDNVGLAQYKLIHQVKESGFPDVTFALGTTQTLYLGDFLYANSSSPSNFTVFAFHEQELNPSNQQTDYLICHLIQEQGQKKSIEDIKASLKQTVQVPRSSNPTPTVCYSIEHILWKQEFVHGETQPAATPCWT